jgi:aspartyl/asparaginyl-tRNA synthetase
MSRPI